jgi:hypothetical protein
MTAGRILLVTVAAALAAASVHVTLPRRAAGDLLTIVRETDRGEGLAGRLATAQRFSGGKYQAAAELIAGQITLRQAVERFRELNALVEGYDGRDGVAPFLVASSEEPLWRNVLLWVEAEVGHRNDPSAAEIRTRLRAEYRERFGRDPEPVR